MKQRLAVRAIIKRDEKTLLIRREGGRPSLSGRYELPGGRIEYGEQPEDALRRYLHDDCGLHIQTAQLFDAVTYLDQEEREIQYGVLVYLVSPATSSGQVTLSKNYNKYLWAKNSSVQHDTLTDLTELLLGIIHQDSLAERVIAETSLDNTKSREALDAVIYTDGGSRGNPGPSACGYVILDHFSHVIDQGGEYLGITTNNQAEYHGVRLALERALALNLRRVRFCLDSMLVVNQMNGIYKIKNRELWPIHERIRLLMREFEKVSFTHVHREFNQMADAVVNKTLDTHIDNR